jgi:SSS family solute:Na+ symporter
MITRYDFGIIIVYLLFTLGVGLVFRRLSKTTSDYFRAGGAMPWWLTGTSAWIASFSAWTFVGAAGKAYETGTLVLWAFWPMAAGLVVVYLYTCTRFRRTRVVTWVEAVRNRYGPGTEQFYTWVKVPLGLLLAGVSLNAVGVFMASVFGLRMTPMLVTLGTVVTLVALVGGAWAVLASDFIQSFLIVTITLVVAVLALAQPRIGGVAGLFRQLPAAHLHWGLIERPPILLVWVLAQLWFKFSDANNLENSTMYLMARNDRNARRMVLIPLAGAIVGPLIFFVPPLAAAVTHPNLAAEFPNLSQPHEAAFVAVAHDVMPVGMIGLMVCAMLGATLTSMDAGLNKNVGVFVRSFYRPVVAPNGSDKHLLVVSKLCTLGFGLAVVAIAVEVNRLRTMGLFDLTNLLAATLLMPMALPLIYGLFVRRTPAWSAWTTALVGFAVGYAGNAVVTAERVARVLGWTRPLSDHEATDLRLAVVTLGTVLIGSGWYFATSLFFPLSSPGYRDRVDRFFTGLATPIDERAEGIIDRDDVIYRMIGQLCLAFGAFVLALSVVVPNPARGRLCFVFCGGTIFLVGWGLARRAQVLASRLLAAAPATGRSEPSTSTVG